MSTVAARSRSTTRTGGLELAVAQTLQAAEIDVDLLASLIVRSAVELPGVEAAWILAVAPGGSRVLGAAGPMSARRPSAPSAGEEAEIDVGACDDALTDPVHHVDLRRPVPADDPVASLVRGLAVPDDLDRFGCAAMRNGDELVGVLVAGGSTGSCGPDETAALATLAAQASIGLRACDLRVRLTEHSTCVLRTFDAHRRLHEAAADGDVSVVLKALALILHRPLALDQTLIEPYRVDGGVDVSAMTPMSILPLTVSGRQVGHLRAYGALPLTATEENLLRQGAETITLALVQHRSISEVEWRLRGDLLDELVQSALVTDSARARAARLGLDLDEPHRVLVVETRTLGVEPATLMRSLTGPRLTERSGVLAVQRDGRLVIAVIGDEGRARSVGELLLSVAGRDSGVAIGVSSARRQDFASSLREGQSCATFAIRAGSAGAVVDHASLGPLRFMLDAPSVEHAAALVTEQLGPLATYEEKRGGELLNTLRVYLEEGGRHQAIAARCHIHQSTVKYRLARIAEVLGGDLSSAGLRHELWVSVQLLDLFRLVGTDLLSSVERPATEVSRP